MGLAKTFDLVAGTALRHLPVLAILWLVTVAIFAFGQRLGIFGESLTLPPDSLASTEAKASREVSIYSLLPRDAIRSIDAPTFVTSTEAEEWMQENEQVIGLELAGEVRAYPINVLSRHEIINDVIADVPVAVTYCPLCFTGIVYDRRVEGRTLEFGVSGKLVMNDLVMYDRQTGSLWQQILGEGISGHFYGTRLKPVSAVQTTWGRWLERNPDTLVLDKGGDYRSDSYAGYYESNDLGVISGSGIDNRLDGKALVLGVIAGREPKAYPFGELVKEPVVNDRIGTTPILVVYDATSDTAVAFERRSDGRDLTFSFVQRLESFLIQDAETGTRWSALTGKATEGPLAGTQLRQLAGTYAFWFAWSDFYVQTEVYSAGDVSEEAS